jgi:hypothetical protein
MPAKHATKEISYQIGGCNYYLQNLMHNYHPS